MQVSSLGQVTPSKRRCDSESDSDSPSVLDLFDPYRPRPGLKRVKREVEAIPFAITPPPTIDIPLLPSLYHLATSAHLASSRHLQQIFVPHTTTSPTGDIAPIKPSLDCTFTPDPAALDKATALLVLALDALRTGLAIKSISEKERVAFSVEFGHVATKLLQAAPPSIDMARIRHDAREAVGLAVGRSRLAHAYTSCQCPAALTCASRCTSSRSSTQSCKELAGARLLLVSSGRR